MLLPLTRFIVILVIVNRLGFSQVKANFMVEQSTITQGMSIPVTLTLIASEPMAINLGENRTGAIQFVVRGPDNLVKSVSVPLPTGSGIRLHGSFQLEANRTYEQSMLLEASSFAEPGIYDITVNIKQDGNPIFTFSNGNQVQVTVNPYSAANLRNSCSELEDKLSNASDAGRKIVLSNALATIHNPIALPFLVDSIDHVRGFDYQLIRGIEHISSPDAVAAISKMLHSANEETATAARSSLIRLSQNGQDAQIHAQALQAPY